MLGKIKLAESSRLKSTLLCWTVAQNCAIWKIVHQSAELGIIRRHLTSLWFLKLFCAWGLVFVVLLNATGQSGTSCLWETISGNIPVMCEMTLSLGPGHKTLVPLLFQATPYIFICLAHKPLSPGQTWCEEVGMLYLEMTPINHCYLLLSSRVQPG